MPCRHQSCTYRNDIARGLEPAPKDALPSPRLSASNYPIIIIAFVLFFFHLGNAAMLPMLGQAAVARFQVDPAVYTAGTVFIAQITMIATSLLGARMALKKGYGLLFLFSLAALPIRGLIAYLYASPWSIIPVQILYGVGAGLMGVATPGIVAVLLKGSGHVNTGLGFVLTIQGVGAALSTSYAGFVANLIDYSSAFLALALAPCLGLLLFLVAAKTNPLLQEAVSPLQGRGKKQEDYSAR